MTKIVKVLKTMKKVFRLLSVANLGLLAGFVATHAPAKAQTAPGWSGVYVGGHLGYNKSKSETNVENFNSYRFNDNGVGVALYGQTPFGDPGSNTLTNAAYSLVGPFSADLSEGALAGGIHLGVRQQFDNFVIGVEGRFSASKTVGEANNYVGGGSATYYNPTANTVFAGGIANAGNQNIFDTVSGTLSDETLSISSKLGSSFSAVGRFGFLATPSFMIYGLAGLSVAQVEVVMNYAGTATYSSDPGGITQGAPDPYVTHTIAASTRKKDWMAGWTIGAGIETFLGDNMTLRAEYTYSDYNKLSSSLADGSVATGYAAAYLPIASAISGAATADASTHSVKVGISFMLN